MFIKHVKSIDNKSLLSFDLFSPNASRFVFIFSSLKLIIIDKHVMINHFRRYRKMHTLNQQYSIIESLQSFQTLDIQSEENIILDHSLQQVTFYKDATKNNKKSPQQKKKVSPQIPEQQCATEVFWISLAEQLIFYIKDEQDFKQCLTLEIEKPMDHTCYGKLLDSQLYLLHNNELYLYKINLQLPGLQGSSYELLMRLNLKELDENLYFLSLKPLTLYSDRGLYKFQEDFTLEKVAKFKWPSLKIDDETKESKLIKPQNFQFVEQGDIKLVAFPQPQQKVYLIQSSTIQEKKNIQNIISAGISPYLYMKTPKFKDFEGLKQSKVLGQPYSIMVLAYTIKFKDPQSKINIVNNCIGFYQVPGDKLLMVVKDIIYEIDRMYFLTPYDLIYQDSANHVGLIQLNIKDVGLVCK